jgi:tetratricopeptide (TPR) repeat protein
MCKRVRTLAGWSITALAIAMWAGKAPETAAAETVAEADRLVQAGAPSVEALRGALEIYERAAAADTRESTLQVKIAGAALDLGTRIEEGALEWFQRGERAARRAVELDPKSADGHFLIAANRGRAAKLLPLWKVSPAIVGQLEKDLLRALAIDPRHARALHMEGMLLYKTPAPLRVFLDGKKRDVERLLSSAVDADPGFATARLDLAEFLLEAKRPAEARAHAQAVLELTTERARRYKPAAEALLRRIPAS